MANHEGIVWRHVISLNREDAECLGFDQVMAWKSLLSESAEKVSKALGNKTILSGSVSKGRNEPSQSYMSLNTVRASIRRLTESGYIKVEKRKRSNGGGTSHYYWIVEK